VSSGYGKEMINSWFLESLGDRRVHPEPFSEKKGFENSSLGRKWMFVVGGWKVTLDFLQKLLTEDWDETERRVFFSRLYSFNEERAFGGGSRVDILAFEISGHRACFEISEALRRKEPRRNLELVVDKEMKWRRKFFGMGHGDPEVPLDILLFILIKDFVHFYEEEIPVLRARGRFIKPASKVGIGCEF
jgi:hypothetical protein